MGKQLSTFKLGETFFGIDIILVNEINRHLDITPVAQAPEYINGLLNLRGQIVTVLDLGIKLGMGPCEIQPSSRCIILKTSQALAHHKASGKLHDDTATDVIGFLVDHIGDIVLVEDSQIEAPPANVGAVSGKYISGVAKFEGKLIVMLMVKEILK